MSRAIPPVLIWAVWLALFAAGTPAQEGSRGDAAPGVRAHVIPIDGEIDWTQHAFVMRATSESRAEGAGIVVFEIDSPGGRIDAMEAIARQIVRTEEAGIRTVAFIRPNDEAPVGGAFSAASYIAMVCQKMYIYPGQRMGDAQPILVGPEGITEGPEKIKSPVRAQFRDIAERRGYPVRLAEAMVDPDVEVFEAMIDGERRFVTGADIEAAKDAGKSVQNVGAAIVGQGKLLTLTESEVVAYGFAKRAETRADIYADLGLRVLGEESKAYSWSESFVAFLTSPVVSVILMIVGVLGIWIELKTPGFGTPGIAGILAFVVLLFGHHLAGLADAAEILLFAAGVVLVAAEIFVLPGYGICAVLGVICIFSGLVLSFQPFVLPSGDSPWQGDIFLSSLARVIVSFLCSSVGFILLVRWLPSVPLLGRHVLQAELSSAGGAVVPSQEASDMLVGKTGIAVTMLRPGGKVEIGRTVYDVVTQGDFIAKDDPVTVIAIEGTRIIVERAEKK